MTTTTRDLVAERALPRQPWNRHGSKRCLGNQGDKGGLWPGCLWCAHQFQQIDGGPYLGSRGFYLYHRYGEGHGG